MFRLIGRFLIKTILAIGALILFIPGLFAFITEKILGSKDNSAAFYGFKNLAAFYGFISVLGILLIASSITFFFLNMITFGAASVAFLAGAALLLPLLSKTALHLAKALYQPLTSDEEKPEKAYQDSNQINPSLSTVARPINDSYSPEPLRKEIEELNNPVFIAYCFTRDRVLFGRTYLKTLIKAESLSDITLAESIFINKKRKQLKDFESTHNPIDEGYTSGDDRKHRSTTPPLSPKRNNLFRSKVSLSSIPQQKATP